MFPVGKYTIGLTLQSHYQLTNNKICYLTLADKVKWWHILLTVIAAILCVPGVSLWIAVGVVLSEPADASKYIF